MLETSNPVQIQGVSVLTGDKCFALEHFRHQVKSFKMPSNFRSYLQELLCTCHLCLNADGGRYSWAVRTEDVDSCLNVQMQIKFVMGCLVCCAHQIQAAETTSSLDLPQPHPSYSHWTDNCDPLFLLAGLPDLVIITTALGGL